MDSTIIVALMAFGGTAVGTIVGAIASSKVTDLRLRMLESQVSEIAKKQDNLNNLEKRLIVLETKLQED